MPGSWGHKKTISVHHRSWPRRVAGGHSEHVINCKCCLRRHLPAQTWCRAAAYRQRNDHVKRRDAMIYDYIRLRRRHKLSSVAIAVGIAEPGAPCRLQRESSATQFPTKIGVEIRFPRAIRAPIAARSRSTERKWRSRRWMDIGEISCVSTERAAQSQLATC